MLVGWLSRGLGRTFVTDNPPFLGPSPPRVATLDALNASLSGRYAVEREIGAGGMATVYLARDVRHERQVAIKVLREELSASLGKERFLREIKVAAALQHPHVLPLFDSGDVDGLLFYVMPFVDGMSLRDRLAKEGELPVTDAARILRDVADALSEAHKHGVVHRDLKPENVMLRGRHALVTDFGVAKALSEATGRNSLTSVGIALGTPTYMAPEQAVADPHVDQRADIYAFGVMAYELLTGRPPFTGLSPQQVLAAHVTSTAEAVTARRPSIPPVLATLIMKCLEKKPADRWQSAEELVPMLESVLTPSGGLTPAETQPLKAAAPPKWRTMVAVGGVVLAAAAVVAIAFVAKSRVASGRQSGSAEASIAVLPFESGGDTTNDYLADGIADELRSGLTKLASVRVKSRSASMRFRGSHLDAKTAGAKLEVTRILQGTISRVGTRLHVTADLVNVATDDAVWSGTFDRPATDLGGIQDSISLAVSAALGGTAQTRQVVSGARDRGTSDPVAYDDFLKARFVHDPPKGILFLKDAVGRDPKFARGYAGLASYYAGLTITGIGSRDSAMALANENLRKAEAIDSSLIDVYEARALIATMNVELREAAKALSKAVSLDSSDSQLMTDYSYTLANLGRIDEALAAVRRARKADALDLIPLVAEQYYLMLAHDYRGALDLTPTIVSIDSAFVPALENTEEAYIFLAKPDSALIWAKRGFAIGGSAYGGRGTVIAAYAALGRWADVDRERALAKTDPPSNSPQGARVYDQLLDGNVDSAMTALERSVADREPNLAGISIACEPLLDPLHSSPRFAALMTRLGARACAPDAKWPFPKRPK
jgi:serine/threonine-protein kinase